MALDAFIMFKSSTASIWGESTRKGYEKWIGIENFSFDIESSVHISSGTSGAGAGKVTFNKFTISKVPDTSSPLLFQSCAAGDHFSEVSIVLNKAGGTHSIPYLRFDFGLVYISKVAWSLANLNDIPLEQISFEYAAVQIRYTPQKPDGTSGSSVLGSWDRIANTKSSSLISSS